MCILFIAGEKERKRPKRGKRSRTISKQPRKRQEQPRRSPGTRRTSRERKKITRIIRIGQKLIEKIDF